MLLDCCSVPCKVPVDSVTGASTCHSVQGSLTLYTGPDSNQNYLPLTSSILREIRSAMDEDLYVSGSIQKTIFTGQRGMVLPPPSPETAENPIQETLPQDTNSRSSALVASLLLALILLLVATIVLVLFLVRKGKKNIKFLKDISTSSEEGGLDGADETPPHSSSDGSFPCLEDQEQSYGNVLETKITVVSFVQPEKQDDEGSSVPDEGYLKSTLALARSLPTELVDFSYRTYDGDSGDDEIASAASSSHGGLHLVDEDEDDTVFESLRKVTEIDFSDIP
jgi:hypothetical protein